MRGSRVRIPLRTGPGGLPVTNVLWPEHRPPRFRDGRHLLLSLDFGMEDILQEVASNAFRICLAMTDSLLQPRRDERIVVDMSMRMS